jgi:5-methylcytosine-specific restriction endonuclease McrA
MYYGNQMAITKVCSKCGVEKPVTDFYKKKSGKFGVEGCCKECTKAAVKAYRLTPEGKANKKAWDQSDKAKASAKEYWQSPAGKAALKRFRQSPKYKELKARHKKTQRYRDTLLAYKRSDKSKAQDKAYKETPAGKESSLKAQKKHSKTEKRKASAARCATKRRTQIEILSTLTADEWIGIKESFKQRCVYCGEKKHLTMDHIIPVSKGGFHIKGNIVPACRSCNSRKNNKSVLLQLLVPDIKIDVAIDKQ